MILRFHLHLLCARCFFLICDLQHDCTAVQSSAVRTFGD